MYDIYVDYCTGDSFGEEIVEGEALGLPVSNIDKAKENLKRIKEHYEGNSDSANYGDKYNLTLLSEDGERTVLPFWIGYFEYLIGAEIREVDDGSMYFRLL